MNEHFNAGDRVEIAETEHNGEIVPAAFGAVDRDMGGAVVHVAIDGDHYSYPHQVPPIPRELVTLVSAAEEDEDALDKLIAEHSLKAVPIYVGSFDGAPTREHDYDIYDVLLTIETAEIGLYGGTDHQAPKRTMLVRGHGQSYAKSLPQNGGALVLPTAAEVLTDAFANASDADIYDSAEEWADDRSITGRIHQKWAEIVALNKDLRAFLGDAFEDFTNAL